MDFQNVLLQADALSRVFVAAFILVGIPCLIYALSLQKDARLAVAAVGFLAAALGVVLARDFLSFLIFWELTVLLACCLILHDRKPASFAVMYRYFLIQLLAGTSLFFGIALQYAAIGSFEMTAVVPEARPFFLVAFLIKAAVVPLHVWVPLTYPSVPPAIAVILSAYSTKIGVYAFARLLPGIPWIAYTGAFMALFGVAMALRQKTARRLLSYHLVSQVGYMIAGIGLGTELGVGAGTFHMLNNMIYKSLLFMVAGAVMLRTGTDRLTRMSVAGRSMPLTFVAALLGAAAISGLPPLNGYVSKTLLKAATQGHDLLQGALLLAGVGTALSFAKFIWYLFLQKRVGEIREEGIPGKLSWGVCLAMGILALLCLGLGVFPSRLFMPGSAADSVRIYDTGSVFLGTVGVVGGTALFGFSRRLIRPLPDSTLAYTGSRSTLSAGRKAAEPNSPKAAPPWDIDVAYVWLLSQVLRLSRWVAGRARDETQAYILVIAALLVGLIALLGQ